MYRCFFIGIAAWVSSSLFFSASAQASEPGLLPAQTALLESSYPGFTVFRSCTGRFGGLDSHDIVLGIHSKNGVHRVGMIWDGTKWVMHDIGAEILKDKDISYYGPIRWNYSVNGDSKEDFRCNFQLGKDDRIGGIEGDEPFFDLKKFGLEKSTIVCFETDDTYNNWDCLVYSPKDERFKLWFQQAHAD